MFARHVSFRLKPNTSSQFTQIIEQEILPLLQKQRGFKDEITFVSSEGNEAVGISLWDAKESAEAYNRESYQKVLTALNRVLDGTPLVRTFDVANSTFHKIAARAAGT